VQGLFCDLIFPVFLHRRGIVTTRTTYRFLATIRLLTHSHILFILLLTAAVPSSCHPSRLYLPSTLLFVRIITKLFYQKFYIHLGQVHTFPGLVLRPLSSFQSVKLFFFFVFAAALLFFLALRTPRVQRLRSPAPTFKLVILFCDLILTLTLTLHHFQVPTSNAWFDSLIPDAFYGVGKLIWVRLIGVLCTFIF
jgi:hypothetical protein